MPPLFVRAAVQRNRSNVRQGMADADNPPDPADESLADSSRVLLTWPRALLAAAVLMVLTGGRGPVFVSVLLGLTLWWSAASVQAGLRGLGLHYRLPQDRIFSGGRARIEVSVVNRSRWPIPLCEVSARLPDDLHGRFHRILTVPARTTRSAFFDVTGIHRGVYRLGDTHVVLSDWFGLFEETALVSVPGRLLVYPGGETTADDPLRRLPLGPRRAPTSPFADDLPTGVRPYRPGDSLRTVAWKQTARRGELQAREYPHVRESATWIYLDLCSDEWTPLYRHERTEAAIAVAASLVRQETAQQRAVGLATWGALTETTVHGTRVTAQPGWMRSAPRADPGQAPRLLELLAAVRHAPGPDFSERLRLEGGALSWGTRALILIPRDTPALWQLGAAWTAHGHPVTLLVFERSLGRPEGLHARSVPEVHEVGGAHG